MLVSLIAACTKLAAIAKPVKTVVGVLLDDWKTGRESNRKVNQAISDNRARLALSETSHNSEWELKTLEQPSVWLRRFTAFVFFWPLVWGYFDPVGVKAYFELIEEYPEAYWAGVATMMAVIWSNKRMQEWRAGKSHGN
ncbi:MAG: hypothetical protein ACPGMR_11460 [Pontibacterium sp.]